LALDAANADLTNNDRAEIQAEIGTLINEIDRIADTTTFNKKQLLNGSSNAVVSTNNPTLINGLVVGNTGSGGVFSIVINASAAGSQQVQLSSIFTTDGSTTATTTTQLNSIASFSGMFATSKQLTLWGNAKSATVTLSGTDTLDEAMGKISLAIADSSSTTDLGMDGAIVGGSEPNLARVITSGATSGSVEISSAMPGNVGEITFSGDSDLLTAFGFTDVVSSSDATYTITAIETTDNTTYTQTVKGNRAYNLVPGIDVIFDATTDLEMQPNAAARPGISVASGSETYYMAVNPAPLQFKVTGTGAELDTKRINDLGSQALGVDQIDVVGQDKANRSATIIQGAMDEVSKQRSMMGVFENEYARSMGRLSGIKLSTEQAESLIRDTDIAQEMINYTQNKLLIDTSAAMFTQANMMPSSIWSLLYK